MTTLEELLALKRVEAAAALRPAAEDLVPSTRAFAYYCATGREELAIVPLLAPRTPAGDARWDGLEFARETRRLAAGSAHAIAVATDPRFGGQLDDLRAAAATTDTTPLLRYDFVLGPADVFASRAAGADALWLHAFLHEADVLAALVRAAASLHVETVLGVRDATELGRALALRPRFVGIHATPPEGGSGRLADAVALARTVPEEHAVVVFGGVETEDDLASLHGVVDAVVLLPPFAARADIDEVIDRANDG